MPVEQRTATSVINVARISISRIIAHRASLTVQTLNSEPVAKRLLRSGFTHHRFVPGEMRVRRRLQPNQVLLYLLDFSPGFQSKPPPLESLSASDAVKTTRGLAI